MADTWTNWSRTARATPARIETPSSTDAVVEIVRRASAEGTPVRAVGGGLSSSAIAVTPGTLVQTRGLRGLRRIDPAAGTATFGAGTRVAEAAALLEAEGLALANPTSNTTATLAGSAATGSHGSSLRLPSASSQLVSAVLVTGTGEVIEVGERKNVELWPAVRLSLGALGIMTEVTVRTVPMHRVLVDDTVTSWRRALDGLPARASAVDHLTLRWMPHTDRVAVRSVMQEPGPGGDAPEPGAISTGVRRLGDRVRAGLVRGFPALVPALNRFAPDFPPTGQWVSGPVGALATTPPLPYATMSYHVPFERATDVLGELRNLIGRSGLRVPTRVLVTFTPQDDAYLSPSYRGATAMIGLTMPTMLDPRAYFDAAEAMFLEQGGLPHWGTYHTVRAAEFAHVMPRYGDFRGVRHTLDPQLRFGNAYLRRVLGE